MPRIWRWIWGFTCSSSSLVAALLLLSACNRADARTANPPAPKTVDAVELIQRDALFGNPERINVQISPDGKHLSWVAPFDEVQNVWVAPVGDLAAARAVTADKVLGATSPCPTEEAAQILS